MLSFCTAVRKRLKPLPYPREPKTLGDHMKKRRYDLHLFQKQVACRLKVNEWTIVNWENHKIIPEVRYLPRIIEFLGFDPFPPPHTFGERIVTKRRVLGLSRKRLGVDEGALARWERGAVLPRGKQCRRMQKFLSFPG